MGECPTSGGFEVWCVPDGKMPQDKLPFEGCQGNPVTKDLNDANNGHCSGPFKVDGVWGGGWHRGTLYEVREAMEAPKGSDIKIGDHFIQFGDWRMGQVDASNHFSISHKDGKTAQIYRNDGTRHPGPRNDWNTFGKSDSQSKGVTFGDGFVQIGDWRFGQVDANHASISHKGGKTAQIFRQDGTLHPGPRNDWNTFGKSLTKNNVKFGDKFIQFGNFRIGQVDGSHFSISHKSGKTEQIYRKDGTLHPGPRNDYGLWGRSLIGEDSTGSLGCFDTRSRGSLGWSNKGRTKSIDTAHSWCKGSKYMSLECPTSGGFEVWCVPDGKMPQDKLPFEGCQGNPVTKDLNDANNGHCSGPFKVDGVWGGGWHRGTLYEVREAMEAPKGSDIKIGDHFIQFGDWRMGQVDASNHFSISHKDGKTAQIYRNDGTRHPGPRNDWNTFGKSDSQSKGVTFGDGFV